MKSLKWMVLCLALMTPAASHAVGVSFSGGVGGAYSSEKTSTRTALELSPFIDQWIFRLEVPLELQTSPKSSFAIRPGIKAFVPLIGLYGRLGYGLGNVGGEGDLTHSIILGIGEELSLFNTVGVFIEATDEPLLNSSNQSTSNIFMFRLGAMVNL